MRAIATGSIPRVSKAEGEIAEILCSMGIGFSRQVTIRDPATGRYGACVDFLLADGRALEFNGTFWHADPRVYPNGPVHSAQRRTCERYAAKTALLARLGIPLVVVWELDFRKDPRKALEVALRLPP